MSADELVPHLPDHAVETLTAFLRSHCLYHGNEGALVGLSGGVDSALVARLASDALGAEKVLGISMPDAAYPGDLARETEQYARSLEIEHRALGIEKIETAFRSTLPEIADRVTLGNTKARIRMSLLYAIARERRRVVVGTGNKSELLLGYFTKYGDGGADLLPIGDLYKTEVLELSAELNLPRSIREREPTAGLWEGQTDEEELGLPYAQLDRILHGLERGLS
ncbi:MAG: NAD+ synthase, partial [Thermoplasmata archaeon]